MELALLKLLENKDMYLTHRDSISKDIVSPEVGMILTDLDEWYKDEDTLDWPSFSEWFTQVRHCTFSADKVKLFVQLFKRMETYDPPKRLAADLVQGIVEQSCAEKIVFFCNQVVDGTGSMDNVIKAVSEYEDRLNGMSTNTKEDEHGWGTILSNLVVTGGLKWRMDCLNRAVGPVRRGDLIVFGGQVEGGKSTWMCDQALCMLQQLGDLDNVVWFTNEQTSDMVQFRLLQSATGLTNSTIFNDTSAAEARYNELYGEKRIIVHYNAALTKKEVIRVLKKYKPKLILFDQLRKVRGFGESGSINTLASVFQAARGWANEYGPVITVHQLFEYPRPQMDNRGNLVYADPYMGIESLYGSRIEIQGEADVLIMMGKDPKDKSSTTRYLNIVKNKLLGDDGTAEEDRHGKYEVKLLPKIGRFKG